MKQGTRLALNVHAGDALPPESGAFEALRTGKLVIKENGPHVFGFPYFTVAVPLKADGRIAGGIAFLIPSAVRNIEGQLVDLSGKLAQATQNILMNAKNILGQSQVLTESAQNLSESSDNVGQHVSETEKLMKFIDTVSRDIKLLGVNASIEAAHSGEYGRGFKVVANEIQELAFSSASYAGENQTVVNEIRVLMTEEKQEIQNVTSGIREVNTAIGQINEAIEVLENTAAQLNMLAQKI